MRWAKLVLGFTWALPTSFLGLLVAILGGARPYALRPALCWHWVPWWGFWAWWYRPGSRWAAITLGHVSIFSDAQKDDAACVRHERVHTKQAWVLGPIFLPIYCLMYLLEVRLVGEADAYRNIPLEVAAYKAQSTPDAWG